MAKGTLLAQEVQVKDRTLVRGKVVGNDEIMLLNEAGITSITVIKVGINDLLANAAVNRIARQLAGPQLLHIPATGGCGSVIATHIGLLTYVQQHLNTTLAAHPDFTVDPLAPHSLVKPHTKCASITARPVVMPQATVVAAAAALPILQVRPCVPLSVSCIYTGSSADTWWDPILAHLKIFGSTVHQLLACANYPTRITQALTQITDADADVAIFAIDDDADLTRLSQALANTPQHAIWDDDSDRWLVANSKSTTILAVPTKPSSAERIKHIIKLLNLIHAGIALDEQKSGTSLYSRNATLTKDKDNQQLQDQVAQITVQLLGNANYPVPEPIRIHDPWGTITLAPHEAALLDTPLVQQLRRIKQLGGAQHTRFEHTVGFSSSLEV